MNINFYGVKYFDKPCTIYLQRQRKNQKLTITVLRRDRFKICHNYAIPFLGF